MRYTSTFFFTLVVSNANHKLTWKTSSVSKMVNDKKDKKTMNLYLSVIRFIQLSHASESKSYALRSKVIALRDFIQLKPCAKKGQETLNQHQLTVVSELYYLFAPTEEISSRGILFLAQLLTSSWNLNGVFFTIVRQRAELLPFYLKAVLGDYRVSLLLRDWKCAADCTRQRTASEPKKYESRSRLLLIMPFKGQILKVSEISKTKVNSN